MVLLWVYRMFVESQLHKPPFCSDNYKYNKSCSGAKLENPKHSERSNDYKNQWKKIPGFQKKKVFYFSPTYFSQDETCTIDNMYKFYLKSLDENYSNHENHTKHPSEVKTEVTNLHYEVYNIQDDLSPAKNTASCTTLEKELKKDVENQDSARPLTSKTFDIFHYYSLFPFNVSKMIFDCHNSGYYYVKYPDEFDVDTKLPNTFDSNAKLPDPDIYSIDDQAFENFCLEEAREKIEESTCNMLLKSKESADEQTNDYHDRKCNLLRPEIYEPYCNLNSETIASMGTFDLWQSNCVDDESQAYFKEKSFQDVEVHKAEDFDCADYERKFQSVFRQEKYNFSLAKIFRNLLILNRKKITDETTVYKSD